MQEGRTVIPILILFGLVLGRWWRLSLTAGAMGWPVLLVATDTMDFDVGLLGAAGLAVANTGVGVLVHQGVLRTFTLMRRRRAPDRIGAHAEPTLETSSWSATFPLSEGRHFAA